MLETVLQRASRVLPQKETLTRFFRLVFRKAILTQDLYDTDRLTADPTDNVRVQPTAFGGG